eukprot:684348-Pleurochrysis_carterae.AAC.1
MEPAILRQTQPQPHTDTHSHSYTPTGSSAPERVGEGAPRVPYARAAVDGAALALRQPQRDVPAEMHRLERSGRVIRRGERHSD